MGRSVPGTERRERGAFDLLCQAQITVKHILINKIVEFCPCADDTQKQLLNMHQAAVLWLVTLFAVGFAAPRSVRDNRAAPIKVPVVTKYITTEVATVEQDETLVLVAQLCQQSKGQQVNVSVLLNNNPEWEPSFGVVRYYVVDSPAKTLQDALCTNVVDRVAGPTCFIKSWSSANDMYIMATAGQSSAISFTLDAEFSSPTGDNTTKTWFDRNWYEPKVRADTVYLSEIVALVSSQSLLYHQSALMTFSFCPTPKTGKAYEIRATVFGTDGQSSYALYLCDKLPCVVDGDNVVAHNGRQLPSNSVATESKQWTTMYALVVCWGGVFNGSEYVGHFLFNANQMSSPV